MMRPETGGDMIEVTLPQSGEFQSLSPGDTVHLGWSDEKAHVFAGEAL
jgi:spermidine/putrescine transport system ATP-binding protein